MRTRRAVYGELGLFWNPFGAPEHADWPSLIAPQVDLAEFARRLLSPRFALTFRGDAGRGKSTHLRALHAHFANQPYTYLGPNASPRTGIPDAEVIFVDEVERLSPWRRHRLFAGRRPLALACHGDLRGELKRGGRQVLDIDIRGLDEARLARVVHKRIAWAQRDGSPDLGIDSRLLTRLLDEHADDLRSINAALYDHVETRRRIQTCA